MVWHWGGKRKTRHLQRICQLRWKPTFPTVPNRCLVGIDYSDGPVGRVCSKADLSGPGALELTNSSIRSMLANLVRQSAMNLAVAGLVHTKSEIPRAVRNVAPGIGVTHDMAAKISTK